MRVPVRAPLVCVSHDRLGFFKNLPSDQRKSNPASNCPDALYLTLTHSLTQ